MPSKFYTLLQQLPPQRRRRFLDFLASPYFNRRAAPLKLAQAACQHLEESPDCAWTDADAYAQVRPDKPLNLNQLRKLRSATLDLLTQFIALENWREQPFAHGLHLLQGLNQLSQSPHFESYHRQSQPKTAPDTLSGLLFRSQNAQEQYKYELKQGRSASPTLANARHNFALWTACEEVRLAYLQLNQARITGTPTEDCLLSSHSLSLLNAHLDELPREGLGYFLLYQCSTALLPEAPYQHLRGLLQQIPKKEAWARDLLFGVLNFCYRRLNEGQNRYLSEIRSWYDWMMVEGVLLENGLLEPAQLKNAVVIGLRLKEFDWVENLIGNYAPKGLATTFCMGLLAYQQHDHAAAQAHFHEVLADPVDLFFGLDARVYLLRSYFETEDSRSLESYGNAFRVFLQRHPSLSGKRRRRYQSFVRLIRKLHQIPLHKTKQRDRLRNEVEAIAGLPVKDWLLKRISNGE